MFYILLFSGLAVLLVIAGIVTMNRNREHLEAETPHAADHDARRKRKAQRAQSRNARRKRH